MSGPILSMVLRFWINFFTLAKFSFLTLPDPSTTKRISCFSSHFPGKNHDYLITINIFFKDLEIPGQDVIWDDLDVLKGNFKLQVKKIARITGISRSSTKLQLLFKNVEFAYMP